MDIILTKTLEDKIFSSWVAAKKEIPIYESEETEDMVGSHVCLLVNSFLTGKFTSKKPRKNLTNQDERNALKIANTSFLSSGFILNNKWYDYTRSDLLSIAYTGYKIAAGLKKPHLDSLANNIELYSDALLHLYSNLRIVQLKLQ